MSVATSSRRRNPNYYQKGLPYLDKFTHRVIPDAQSLVNSLLSGDIDASNYPSPAGAAQLKANKDLNVLVPPFNSPDGWAFNLKNPWLAKKEVRQAVAYALDMTQFAKDSLYGLGKPGDGPIAPGNCAFDKTLKPIPVRPRQGEGAHQAGGHTAGRRRVHRQQGQRPARGFPHLYAGATRQDSAGRSTPQAIEYATAVDR